MIQLISTKSPQHIIPISQTIRFDTRRHGRLVCGVFILCGIALAFCFWPLSHKLANMADQQTFAAMTLVTLANFWTALWCFRYYAGAQGTIDRKTLTIEPDQFFGLTSRAQRGDFTVARYRALRLIGGQNAFSTTRLVLMGLPQTADIVLFNGSRRKAVALANEIGLLLRLPIETLTPAA